MILKSFFPSVTKRHVERKILKAHPYHLYNIICDVDSYSQFLPLCTHSKILRSSDCGQRFDATLTVGLPPLFSETYISRVSLLEDLPCQKFQVETKSIQSEMFESLSSKWILRNNTRSNNENDSVDGNEYLCDVDFSVEMTVSDPIIVNVLDKVLEEVAGRQVDAFEKRCHQIPYNKPDEYNLIKQ